MLLRNGVSERNSEGHLFTAPLVSWPGHDLALALAPALAWPVGGASGGGGGGENGKRARRPIMQQPAQTRPPAGGGAASREGDA